MDLDSLGRTTELIKWIFDVINWAFDISVPAIFIGGLFIAVIVYTKKKVDKEGSAKGVYLGMVLALEMLLLVTVIYLLPKLIAPLPLVTDDAAAIRWTIIILTVTPGWFFFTRGYSKMRGVISVLFLLVTFYVGWLYNRWVGIILVSMPILMVYYHVIQKTAQVIYPVSDPDDKREALLKGQMFLFHLLGIQYPIWMPISKTAREFDVGIDGDTTRDMGTPGMIWTWPHQTVGSSIGIAFNKVDGPGVVFTRKYERPVALVDMRTQLRVTVVNTVTKDGMDVPAVVFSAFAIDRETWPKSDWSRVDFSRLKFRIGRDYKIDHTEGSYPYSSGRIRSALSTYGIMVPEKVVEGKRVPVYWDDWVMTQVEHVTRQVVSERSLDELWRPRKDGLGMSALDEMAGELKKQLIPKLEQVGVQLFTARIVNYQLDESMGEDGAGSERVKNGTGEKKNHIAQRNIKTWSSYWQQRITAAQTEVEFVYRQEIEKAHAYSKSVLLSAIADSITKAYEIRKDLPRHVIAQYFIHALEEYIKRTPGVNIKDAKERIEKIKELMLYSTSEESESE